MDNESLVAISFGLFVLVVLIVVMVVFRGTIVAAIHYQSGMNALKRRDLKAAKSSFEKSLEANGKFYATQINYGLVLLQTGEIEPSVVHFTRAIEMYSKDFLAHNNRAVAYTLLGRLEEAYSDITIALERNPRIDSGYTNRGRINFLLHRYQEALTDFDKQIELMVNHPVAWMGKVVALDALEKPTEARKAWLQLKRISPPEVDWKTVSDTLNPRDPLIVRIQILANSELFQDEAE